MKIDVHAPTAPTIELHIGAESMRILDLKLCFGQSCGGFAPFSMVSAYLSTARTAQKNNKRHSDPLLSTEIHRITLRQAPTLDDRRGQRRDGAQLTANGFSMPLGCRSTLVARARRARARPVGRRIPPDRLSLFRACFLYTRLKSRELRLGDGWQGTGRSSPTRGSRSRDREVNGDSTTSD